MHVVVWRPNRNLVSLLFLYCSCCSLVYDADNAESGMVGEKKALSVATFLAAHKQWAIAEVSSLCCFDLFLSVIAVAHFSSAQQSAFLFCASSPYRPDIFSLLNFAVVGVHSVVRVFRSNALPAAARRRPHQPEKGNCFVAVILCAWSLPSCILVCCRVTVMAFLFFDLFLLNLIVHG